MGTDPGGRQIQEETQRVLGLPVDLFDKLGERFQAFRRWMLRRQGR